jgi:hypothetical protein
MKERVVGLMAALVATAFLLAPGLSFAQANPCAAKMDKKAATDAKEKTAKSKTGAANPCAATADKKAAKSKMGAENPCAAKNPCVAKNPCAAKK